MKPNIVQVIGERVLLRKTGNQYSGLCSFHADKNPSLSVSEEKGLFHCFGCGESGDVFDFVMKLDSVSFKEAAATLGVEHMQSRRRPTRDPLADTAAVITAWAGLQFLKAQSLLRDVGQEMRLANELKWFEYLQDLHRQWAILSDLSDDLQNPLHILALWESRAAVENLLQDAEPESLPQFPELTPEYRERLRRYVRGIDA